MIQKIRQRHAYFFIAVSIFLPLVVFFSLYHKVDLITLQKSENPSSTSESKLGKLIFSSDAQKSKKGRFATIKVFTKLSQPKNNIFLVQPYKAIKSPDILVYLSKSSLNKLTGAKLNKKLTNALLLGELLGDKPQTLIADRKISKNFKFLLFYSKPFSEVIEQVKLKLKK